MVVLYKDLPSQAEKARQTYEEIKRSFYRGKGVGNVSHVEDYRCNCKYKPGKDNIKRACGEIAGCVNRELFIECLENDCPCGEYCLNQRFQKAEYAKVDVISLPLKGYGLRAMESLCKNQFVMEYLGEVIKNDVFQKRLKQYSEEGLKHFYFMSLQAGEVIDATGKGCVARFINHSCAPNCYVQKWMVGDKYRIGIFTLRDVQEGEELTFDYNADRYGSEAQACHCGEPECRGIIGGTKETSDNILSQDAIEADLLKPILSTDDVLPFIGLMLRSIDKRGMVPGLLYRLRITNDIRILKMFMKLHGSIMLKTYLREHQDNDDILEKTLAIADKLPYKYKNRRVETSHLKEWVEKLSNRDDRIGKICQELLEKWNNLPEFYKIPKYSELGLVPPTSMKTEDGDAMDIDVDKESRSPDDKGKNSDSGESNETNETIPEYEYYDYKSSHDYFVRFTDSHFPFQHISQMEYWVSQKFGSYKAVITRNSSSSHPNDSQNGDPGSSRYWRKNRYGSRSPTTPKQPALPPLAPNWFETTDEYGNTYYYNKYTKETSWERPVVKDDMKTIDGFSKAEIQGIIERAEAMARKAEKERERAAREKAESNKVGGEQVSSANALSESDFRSAIKQLVVDYCSRFKRHMDVPTFKKHARNCAHVVQEKELKRSEWVGKTLYSMSESCKTRIKNFTIEWMKKVVAHMKAEAEERKNEQGRMSKNDHDESKNQKSTTHTESELERKSEHYKNSEDRVRSGQKGVRSDFENVQKLVEIIKSENEEKTGDKRKRNEDERDERGEQAKPKTVKPDHEISDEKHAHHLPNRTMKDNGDLENPIVIDDELEKEARKGEKRKWFG
ncbi:6923_t:CDS:2 [Acaulospora morrowiae]|uniref:[histone H3]-lysine(36) N-trimethyltransferase n=1 Tax=Acaulospora morrowiae TaxID=94023 RepID=A0A9N8VLY3_9GLOM|nr:6923_t:CDS:2 [Acaulospora morrowiae]